MASPLCDDLEINPNGSLHSYTSYGDGREWVAGPLPSSNIHSPNAQEAHSVHLLALNDVQSGKANMPIKSDILLAHDVLGPNTEKQISATMVDTLPPARKDNFSTCTTSPLDYDLFTGKPLISDT